MSQTHFVFFLTELVRIAEFAIMAHSRKLSCRLGDELSIEKAIMNVVGSRERTLVDRRLYNQVKYQNDID